MGYESVMFTPAIDAINLSVTPAAHLVGSHQIRKLSHIFHQVATFVTRAVEPLVAWTASSVSSTAGISQYINKLHPIFWYPHTQKNVLDELFMFHTAGLLNDKIHAEDIGIGTAVVHALNQLASHIKICHLQITV